MKGLICKAPRAFTVAFGSCSGVPDANRKSHLRRHHHTRHGFRGHRSCDQPQYSAISLNERHAKNNAALLLAVLVRRYPIRTIRFLGYRAGSRSLCKTASLSVSNCVCRPADSAYAAQAANLRARMASDVAQTRPQLNAFPNLTDDAQRIVRSCNRRSWSCNEPNTCTAVQGNAASARDRIARLSRSCAR